MGWLAGKDAGIYVGWLGIDEDLTVFGGYGPSGVATLALALDRGLRVTYSWATSIIGHRDGTEQRVGEGIDRPHQSYNGEALLVGDAARMTRARMARYAAQGSAFLLGLPHEGLPLIGDAVGASLFVPIAALAACDWSQIGQRVVVMHPDGSASIDAVIQSTSGSQIVLDISPGAVGAAGGVVMPAMAVYLDPQQDFPRYRVDAERWTIAARAAIFDFAPPSASLDLQAASGDAALAGAKVISRIPGVAGNVITFEFNPFVTNPVGGVLAETPGTNTTAQMKGDADTLAALATLLDTSSNVKLGGTYNPAAVISSADGFTQDLAGGVAGAMGTGAVLTMYAGHPVWDRSIPNAGTITDSVQAQTEIVDLGGIPVAIGHATYPAWGRVVAMTSDVPLEWQWAKLMLVTLRGQQRMFWLSTHRDDFTFVSAVGTALVVRTDDDSDIAAWWPTQRDRLALEIVDGTTTYAKILSVADNGNGTQTLTLDTAVAGTVDRVSWLEPCRLNSDSIEVTFGGGGGWSFSFSLLARAYATSDPSIGDV